MARYHGDSTYIDIERDRRERRGPRLDYEDLRVERERDSLSTIAPAYAGGDPFLRDANRGALIRNSATTVVEEPVVEHEHHHLHHHIDHGDVNARLALGKVRPALGREYSYDDLDVKERRYPNGVTVSTIRETRDGYHRHRHRHRHGRHGSVDRRFARSDVDLQYDSYRSRRGGLYEDEERDDFTIVDVPAGSKRVLVNVKEERERDRDVTWRRDRGVRRSRGLGNELWTEITKDLVTKEAIEEMGFPYEETDFFYYIFDYLNREQIDELVDITADLRRERVRDIEYESIAGSTPRMLPGRYDRERDVDTRTEIIVENGRSRPRRRYYY